MLPIHLLGGRSFGQTLLTLVLTLVPALVAWWNDRRLLNKADDPALPELLANRRRLNVRTIAFGVALMIVFGGADAGWGIPVLIVLLIAVAYPLRTRVLGETWGFGAYLWHTAASIVGVALGASTSDHIDMPNACAMRYATPSVGVDWLRSIWLSIDRLTPHSAESCSSVHPFFLRSSRTRSQSMLLIGSSPVMSVRRSRNRFGINNTLMLDVRALEAAGA